MSVTALTSQSSIRPYVDCEIGQSKLADSASHSASALRMLMSLIRTVCPPTHVRDRVAVAGQDASHAACAATLSPVELVPTAHGASQLAAPSPGVATNSAQL